MKKQHFPSLRNRLMHLSTAQIKQIKGGNNNQPVATANTSTIDADEETR
ncbi:MAG: hypothetical protein AAFV95_14245 [Bacteroidota bacterium]